MASMRLHARSLEILVNLTAFAFGMCFCQAIRRLPALTSSGICMYGNRSMRSSLQSPSKEPTRLSRDDYHGSVAVSQQGALPTNLGLVVQASCRGSQS